MRFDRLLRIFRKRWLTIVAITVAITALTAGITYLTPRIYASETTMFVAARNGTSSSDMVSGSTYAQSQVLSYVDVVTTPVVLDPVIETLGLARTADDLARDISVQVANGTVIMTIRVTDHSPEQAARIANEVTHQFIATITALESPPGAERSAVQLTITRPAKPDPNPVSPNVIRNMGLGVAVGLLMGLLWALLRDRMDKAVKTEADLTHLVSLPVLGAIPNDEEATAAPLVSQRPGGLRGEAFKSLRTNLTFIQAGDQPKTIVVTSARPGEGKSTTVANLAMALSEVGERVCVIEGDLRRPKLLDYLGMEGQFGLTNVLVGQATLEDTLQQFGAHDLWVLGSGPIPPNPSELLASKTMRDLLRTLEADFDVVLIDAPPLLPVTDAAVLSRQAGMAVLVVGLGIVERGEVRRALEALAKVDANVVGVVANRVPDAVESTGYYYTSDTESVASPRRAATA